MKSVMQAGFGKTARAEIPRAQFDRSHGIKTTFDAGKLVPILVDEIVPGDTVHLKATLFGRLATPLKPIMDNLRLETFWFFIPNRLVWDNWQKFMGEQEDPTSSIDFTIPTFSTTGTLAVGSLGDYFGLPINKANVYVGISALPFRAYNLVYNEWFRDQNLQDSLDVPKGDGPDTASTYAVVNRGKRHDYFTSCLPWPQKGATAVELPLGTKAFITSDVSDGNLVNVNTPLAGGSPRILDLADGTHVGIDQVSGGSTSTLYADLSTATAATINQLREAFAVQKLLERDARSGTRYIESIYAHFGVTSSDARLQRPEYLGGGSSPLSVAPVANTSDTATANQGDLTGIGTVVADGHGFVKSFEEHGILMGLVNVRADLTYQQGIERFWKKDTRYDFLYPVFAHIGEQAVFNHEIFFNNDANDDLVFGYAGRYDEYRYKRSSITGLFRSDAASSLDAWHLSEDFASVPTLGDTFIQDAPPVDRVIAVSSEPHLIMDGYIKMLHTRPLPVFGTPGLIDHF